MTKTETYAIAILRQAYQPDLQGIESVRFDRDEQHDNINEFDTIEEARERVSELADGVYHTTSGESGRPEYTIVDSNTMVYIQSGRNGDGGNYDWSWNCDHPDSAGNHCGECDSCIAGMRDNDRDLVRANAITK